MDDNSEITLTFYENLMRRAILKKVALFVDTYKFSCL